MTPDEQATLRTLRYFEDEYEAALLVFLRARDLDEIPLLWERQNHWQRVVRGYCKAHRLTPSVAVGSVTE